MNDIERISFNLSITDNNAKMFLLKCVYHCFNCIGDICLNEDINMYKYTSIYDSFSILSNFAYYSFYFNFLFYVKK